MAMTENRAGALAGAAFLTGAVLTMLGFTTAEAFYPGYSTSTQTISALGAADAPAASQLVFNGAMVVAGALTLVAAYGLVRAGEHRALAAVVAVTGVGGFAGVGLFPAQTGLPHLIAALLAFGGIGIAALVAAATRQGPFRYASAALGVFELLALVGFLGLQGSTALGIGGIERWVAYLGAAWAAAFGGSLLAGTGE